VCCVLCCVLCVLWVGGVWCGVVWCDVGSNNTRLVSVAAHRRFIIKAQTYINYLPLHCKPPLRSCALGSSSPDNGFHPLPHSFESKPLASFHVGSWDMIALSVSSSSGSSAKRAGTFLKFILGGCCAWVYSFRRKHCYLQ